MKTAILNRQPSTIYGTIGILSLQNGPALFTIEPPWKNNRPNLSCIIAQTYRVVRHWSPTYGRCWLIIDTKGRTWILIHPGNFGGDTELGLKTNTLGCILPGMSKGWLNYKGTPQRAVLASRTACRHIDQWAGDDKEFLLDIRQAA